jgi:thiamine biosynthesis lipoprotein
MNTDVAVLAPEACKTFAKAAAEVQEVFETVEDCLSRFRSNSELSALNRASGQEFHASELLFGAVSLAYDAAIETSGIFDPTILPALEAAGYDRSFEEIGTGTGTRAPAPPSTGYRAITLDTDALSITLAEGHRIDLGGIGKGLGVDLAMQATSYLPSICVNAGGDLAVRGDPETGEPWTVALEDAGIDGDSTIALRDSALATSTTTKRQWTRDGEMLHHLIDPGTSRPSTSPWRTVTVVARTAVQADVAAKTVLLMGDDGLAFVESRGMHGFVVRLDGSTAATSNWPRKSG